MLAKKGSGPLSVLCVAARDSAADVAHFAEEGKVAAGVIDKVSGPLLQEIRLAPGSHLDDGVLQLVFRPPADAAGDWEQCVRPGDEYNY
eukprot:gene32491-40821_t